MNKLKYILVLKGTNKDLATFEFETLWETYFDEKIILKQIENRVYSFQSQNIIEPTHQLLRRLTFTNYLGIVLNEGKNPLDLAKDLDFSYLENKTFAIRNKGVRPKAEKSGFEERELAKPIWDSLKNPKVSLKNPDYEINYIFEERGENVYLTQKLYENEKDYIQRMPKFRPVKMPYTLKSDLARICINYLKLKDGIVLDPFCGIGGILLEAIDMKFEVIGNDISWNDLKYMKQNIEHYFPEAKYFRILADSATQFLKDDIVDGIVTDIPYGRCCRKLGIDLYENFLKNAKKYLKKGKRMVVVYANFVEFENLARKYFKQIKKIDHYINRSMTRHILVLENKK
ncbi:MAG: DNA methyltransferase [Nanoarchaeota archaeon]